MTGREGLACDISGSRTSPASSSIQNDGEQAAMELARVTKRFGSVMANASVSLQINRGTIHGIVGENGAGKTTLLKILSGHYAPDEGCVLVDGEEVRSFSPAHALSLGIGMVSQHHTLVPELSAIENVILGTEPVRFAGFLDYRQARDHVVSLAKKVGLDSFDAEAPVENLSISIQQKIELIKPLYRKARVLLLDEPTSLLSRPEAEGYFNFLRELAARGTTILFVTHKLPDAIALCSRISVMREAKVVADFSVHSTSEQELLGHMSGDISLRTVSNAEAHPRTSSYNPSITIPDPPKASAHVRDFGNAAVLELDGITVTNIHGRNALECLSLRLQPGEIMGVAGIDGSGQRELAETIVGLRSVQTGRILLNGLDITKFGVRQRQRKGIGFISDDRHREGSIPSFSIADNYLLGHEDDPAWGGGTALSRRIISARAEAMLTAYKVRTAGRGSDTVFHLLSGGNQQKVVIGKALDAKPCILIACQPTRGLDADATSHIHSLFRDCRRRGMAILLFSTDLEEILALSDRIAVLFNRNISAEVRAQDASPSHLVALMTGATCPSS